MVISVEQQLECLTEAYLSDVIPLPEYQRHRADLEARKGALVRQEKEVSQQAYRLRETAGVVTSVETFCQRVSVRLEDATFEQKRQLVELLIDWVIVTGGEIQIHYVIPTNERGEHIRFCHLRLSIW